MYLATLRCRIVSNMEYINADGSAILRRRDESWFTKQKLHHVCLYIQRSQTSKSSTYIFKILNARQQTWRIHRGILLVLDLSVS